MACSTLLVTTFRNHSCNSLLSSNGSLWQCPSLFQFPVHPIVLGHVEFFYLNNHSDIPLKQIFLPDLICYDRQLCDTIQPTFTDGTLHCLKSIEVLQSNTTNYATLIKNVTSYFRACSTSYTTLSELPSSLYQCSHSSKLISKHRLIDFFRDCPLSDDERFNQSCSLNDNRRFQCNEYGNKCYSPIIDRSICKDQLKSNYTQILFHQFCNGQDDHLRVQIADQIHTDESTCEHWPCSNLYTRCDDYRTCPNGEDEWNCLSSDCSSGLFPCLSPGNYSLMCLSERLIGDGKIDCLGALDERDLCRVERSKSYSSYRYRCWNDTKCTAASNLCNQRKDCRYYDDEKICPINRTIQQLFAREVFKRLFFTLDNLPTTALKLEEPSHSSQRTTEVRPQDESWSWRCNRGLYARYRNVNNQESYRCFCPPSYYGDFCEYQSERISLTLGLLVADRYRIYSVLVRLIDDNDTSIAVEQLPFMGVWGCYRPLNIYLLYSSRPKDLSKNYSIHIDIFEQHSLSLIASWYFDIPFLFLPVNRLVYQLQIPTQSVSVVHSCSLTCKNGGICREYLNKKKKFFCQCPSGWMGLQCEQSINCSTCTSNSICVGSIDDQPICVCPWNRVGPRCALSASCPRNSCLNDGQCILIDSNVFNPNWICLCSEQFYGSRCQWTKRRIDIRLDQPDLVSHVLAYLITIFNESSPSISVRMKKSTLDQYLLTFYFQEAFDLLLIQINQDYYLTNLSSTSLIRCIHLNHLVHSSFLLLSRIEQIKFYHQLCQNSSHLQCFFDGYYMCLCTMERHANCLPFNSSRVFPCRHADYCQNDGTCYQDDRTCPSTTICICTQCSFGAQCQFVAESFGVTLDDILRYKFRRSVSLFEQNLVIKVTVIITGLLFVIGLLSSFLSYLTFRCREVREVGCGLYLSSASIVSSLTLIIFVIKLIFLVYSQLNGINNRIVLLIGCIVLEPLLKSVFFIDNWFKACVAIERSVTAFRGVSFNKIRSRQIAKWIIFALPVLIIGTIIHEPLHRDLIDYEEGHHRNWCIIRYSLSLRKYDSIIVACHFLLPFLINLLSAIFVIITVARARMTARHERSYRKYLYKQINDFKHSLISPLILVTLSLPRVILSLLTNCVTSRDPWLYLVTYFISFTPTGLTFVVFVLPSYLYLAQFRKCFQSHSSSQYAK